MYLCLFCCKRLFCTCVKTSFPRTQRLIGDLCLLYSGVLYFPCVVAMIYFDVKYLCLCYDSLMSLVVSVKYLSIWSLTDICYWNFWCLVLGTGSGRIFIVLEMLGSERVCSYIYYLGMR